MQYEQLRAPNLNPVVYENGKALLDWYGWCLATVETAFETARIYSTAWAAWGGTQYRHEDRNFPIGVYFPIWFSGYSGAGHVAIAYVNSNGSMGIWTSPFEHIPYFYTGYHTVDALAEGYKVSYVGWSEDLAGTRIIDLKSIPSPPPVTSSYVISIITPKQIAVKSGMHEWNLALPTFADVCNNPFSTAGDNHIITAVAQLVRSDTGFQNYTYYLENAESPIGWNTLDCADYIPTVDPLPQVPYVPPAAPVVVTQAEKYKVVTTVISFSTADDAKAETKAQAILKEGNYFIYAKDGVAYNLTTNNMKEGVWINILDNKVIVTPSTTRLDPPPMTETLPNPAGDTPDTANWRGTINLAFAGMYVFWNPDKEKNIVDVLDLETGKVKAQPTNGQFSQFSGKIRWTDGNWYGRMRDSSTQFHWYATRIENLMPYNEVYGTKTTLQERQVLHTLTKMDYVELWFTKFKTIGKDIMDIVIPKKGNKQ